MKLLNPLIFLLTYLFPLTYFLYPNVYFKVNVPNLKILSCQY